MKRLDSLLVAVAMALPLLVAPDAAAQRRIIGSADDEEAGEAPPAEQPPPASGKRDAGKKDAGKKDAGKKDAGKKDADKKDAGDRSKDTQSKETKSQDTMSNDVLEGTREDQARRARDEEARAAAARAAEQAAEAARIRQEEEQRRLLEEKRAAEEKRRVENRDQRLAAARKVRNISRASGKVAVAFAVEPGEVKAKELVEIRVDVSERLEVADPRFGSLAPMKGLRLIATVVQPTGKRGAPPVRYRLHSIDGAGRYGFHLTPPRDGQYRVTIDGETKDGASVQAAFALHVGVWPPPDFEEEERNNASTHAARAGRKVFSR